MRDILSSIPVWTQALVTVALAVLTCYAGRLYGLTPGALTGLVLCLPVVAAGLTGRPPVTLVVCAVAVAAVLAESASLPASGTGPAWLVPLLAAGVHPTLGILLASTTSGLCDRIDELDAANRSYARRLFENERRNPEQRDETPPETGAERKQKSVDNAMLLLTLQDVGRRVSTHRNLSSLLPEITGTARTSLRCEHCQVWLWNERMQTFRAPDTEGEPQRFVPRSNAGLTRWVLDRRKVLTRSVVETDYELRELSREEEYVPSAVAPLVSGSELLGLLVVDGVRTEDEPGLLRLTYILSEIYALGLKNAQLFEHIENLARRDGLTGLLNHASFVAEVDRLVERSRTADRPLTVVMSDIDHFKQFNDEHGHQAGDEVLRQVARTWNVVLPEHAVVGRYGGEEFVCAIPDGTLAHGCELAELLRLSTENRPVEFEGRSLRVTASFGVAALAEHATVKELVRDADTALYAAKHGGRNRVEAARPCAAAEHEGALS